MSKSERTRHFIGVAEAAGRTAEAQTFAAEIVQLWPDDAAARNEDAYLQLLLGASDGAAETAEREAQVLVAQEPWNWSARATLGLARLSLGKKEDALAVFRNVRATGSEPPAPLRFALPSWRKTVTKKARAAMRTSLERNISCRKNEPLSLRYWPTSRNVIGIVSST